MSMPRCSNEAMIYLDDDIIGTGDVVLPVNHPATLTLPVSTWDAYQSFVDGGEPGTIWSSNPARMVDQERRSALQTYVDDLGFARPNRAERRRAVALGRKRCS